MGSTVIVKNAIHNRVLIFMDFINLPYKFQVHRLFLSITYFPLSVY